MPEKIKLCPKQSLILVYYYDDILLYVTYSYDGADQKKKNKRVSVLSSGPKRIGVKVVPKSMLPEKKKDSSSCSLARI